MKAAPTPLTRCEWSQGVDPAYERYHDTEWGVPVRDDRTHFEFLVLEGAQAGLSWWTILRKREGYRRAFAGFDPEKVARLTSRALDKLMGDDSIVRNRQKIEAAVTNARAFLKIQEQRGSFDTYVWEFVGGAPIVNRDESFDATVRRLALFAQDEWSVTQQWSVYFGLRWEGIQIKSEGNSYAAIDNRSSVFSPLFQTLYKIPGSKNDQIRGGAAGLEERLRLFVEEHPEAVHPEDRAERHAEEAEAAADDADEKSAVQIGPNHSENRKQPQLSRNR